MIETCTCGHDPIDHDAEHGCAYCDCKLGIYMACKSAVARGLRRLIWGDNHV